MLLKLSQLADQMLTVMFLFIVVYFVGYCVSEVLFRLYVFLRGKE